MSAALLAATTLGLGRWPWAPGTVTSAAVGTTAYVAGPPPPWGLLAAGLAVGALGTWAAGAAERELGPDASAITIDEVAGMLIALAAAPPTPAGYALAFLLFRALDILKPRPLRALHRIPGGLGVVADDVAAGLSAGVLLLLLRAAELPLPWLGSS